MSQEADKNSKRVLAVGVLFAIVGLVALGITMMQPAVRDARERNPNEIFREYTLEEKVQILDSLSADTTAGEEDTTSMESETEPAPAGMPEDEKLRILESLNQ